MKKFASTLCGVMLAGLAFLFISCNSEDLTPSQEIKELRFDIQVINESAPETKVVKTDWEIGDKVYVFFNVTKGSTTEYLNAAKYVTLTYNGTTWDGSLSGDLTNAIELGASGTMYGVFFPFGNVTIVSDGDGGVTFKSSGNTNTALDGLPIFTYYMKGSASYTVSTLGDVATLTGSIKLSIPASYVWFFIDKNGTKYNANEKYRLSVESVKPVACTSFKNGAFSTTSLLQGQPMWGYTYKDAGVAFSGMIETAWTTGQTHRFVFFSDGDPAVAKSFTGKTLSGRESVNLDVSGWTQAVSTPSVTLFNGLKWGNWNLGADAVDQVGLYLQWGGLIEPEKDKYNHKDYGDGSFATMKTILGNNNLDGNYAIYDAARAYLGEGWRMPTRAELNDVGTATIVAAGNTTETVGPVYNTDPAVYLTPTAKIGVKFGTTNSIFLPSSGLWQAANNTTPSDDPKKCCYWSSTSKDLTDAYYMDVYTTTGYKEASDMYKAQGRQIRPIYDPQ